MALLALILGQDLGDACHPFGEPPIDGAGKPVSASIGVFRRFSVITRPNWKSLPAKHLSGTTTPQLNIWYRSTWW